MADERMTPEEAKRETWRMYRNVFGTPDGQAVLVDLLNDLGYFADDPDAVDPQMVAEANRILRRIGVNDVGNLVNFVRGMLEHVPPLGGKDA